MFLALMFGFKAFLAAQLPGAFVGFVVGAFTPAVGRKIKALFVKEGTLVKADLSSAVSKAEQGVKGVAGEVAKKL